VVARSCGDDQVMSANQLTSSSQVGGDFCVEPCNLGCERQSTDPGDDRFHKC
jgi:hypothetical protein